MTSADLVGPHEAARMIGVSPETIWRWVREDKMTATKRANGYNAFTLAEVARVKAKNDARRAKHVVSEKQCELCGKAFMPWMYGVGRFCSQRCNTMNHFKRRKLRGDF